jgi:FkbM family methyltransferase
MNLLLDIESVNLIHNQYYLKKIENNKGCLENTEGSLFVDSFYFYTHPNDTCISDCLKTGVLFEKFLLSFVKQFIDPTKNILDIGANIGVHSVVYSNYLTAGTVYAFEPQPVIYNILLKNIEVNRCDNVVTYNFGASAVESEFCMNAFYDTKANQGAFRICSKEESTGLQIQCKPIDSLKLDNVGYVKIDVEGHEYETLLGMKELLTTNKPVMLIEIHESSPTKASVFALLKEIGYTDYMRLSYCDYLFQYNK